MEIIGNLAVNFTGKEKQLFHLEEEDIVAAQLPCSRVLDEALGWYTDLRRAQEALPANAFTIVPFGGRAINRYTIPLQQAQENIKTAINVGAKVLVYETELALGATGASQTL